MRRLFAGLTLAALSSCASMAPAPSVTPGFIVFFPERSALLEVSADDVISRAAAAAKAATGRPVAVLGWTDSDGSPQADIALSQRRAQAVADALVADGVAPGRISRQGRGQTHDDPGVESRRVEIRIGG